MFSMHHRRGSAGLLAAGLTAACMVSLAGATALPAAAATAPAPAAAQEKTIAIAKPSVVLVSVQWSGQVQVKAGGAWSSLYKASTTCSGAIMSNDGYVVTAGHCTDPAEGKKHIIDAFLAAAVRGGLSRSLANRLRPIGYANWKVEGKESGSDPGRVVGVYPTAAASGITVTTPMQAVVKQTIPFNQGDVALLKVEPQNGPIPALTPAAQDPAEGQSVIATGYPATVGEVVDPGGGASYKPGSTSSLQTLSGAPFTEINAEISPGMSGGPVVDSQGNVVGTVSFQPSAESQPFNFMTRTSMVRQLLSNNGVPLTLSAADKAFRAGLDDYFAGRYHAAAKKFGQVLTTMPSHPQAQFYKSKAEGSFSKESTGPSPWLYAGIGAAVLIMLVGTLGTVLLVRRGRRPTPAGEPTAGGYPTGPATGPESGAALMPPPAPAPYQGAGGPYAPAPAAPYAMPGGPQPGPQSGPQTGAAASPRAGQEAPAAGTVAAAGTWPAEAAPGAEPLSRSGGESGAEAGADGRLHCPDCGEAHAAEARFCPGCGRPFLHPEVPRGEKRLI